MRTNGVTWNRPASQPDQLTDRLICRNDTLVCNWFQKHFTLTGTHASRTQSASEHTYLEVREHRQHLFCNHSRLAVVPGDLDDRWETSLTQPPSPSLPPLPLPFSLPTPSLEQASSLLHKYNNSPVVWPAQRNSLLQQSGSHGPAHSSKVCMTLTYTHYNTHMQTHKHLDPPTHTSPHRMHNPRCGANALE